MLSTPGVTTLPVRAMPRLELEALLTMARLPLAAPLVWGVNSTLKVVLWPGASVGRQGEAGHGKAAAGEIGLSDGQAGAACVGQCFRKGLRRSYLSRAEVQAGRARGQGPGRRRAGGERERENAV